MAPVGVFHHLGSTSCHTSTNVAPETEAAAWHVVTAWICGRCPCLLNALAVALLRRSKAANRHSTSALLQHPSANTLSFMFADVLIRSHSAPDKNTRTWDKRGSQRSWSRDSVAIRFETYQGPRGKKWAYILCQISRNYVWDAAHEKWLKRQ